MPRKKGTALSRVNPGMSEREKVDISIYGDQAKKPHMRLVELIRDTICPPFAAKNTKEDAKKLRKLEQLVFAEVCTAIASKTPRFFERMAEAVTASQTLWRIDPTTGRDTINPSDHVMLAIVEQIDVFLNRNVKVIRPIDIWRELGCIYPLATIRDRITRYGLSEYIPELYVKAGRPKKNKRRVARDTLTLKEFNDAARAYRPKRKLGNKSSVYPK